MRFDATSLGIAIRDARINAGLSLRDVAYAADIDIVRVGEFERGIVMPRADELDAIVRYGHLLLLDTDELLDRAAEIHEADQ